MRELINQLDKLNINFDNSDDKDIIKDIKKIFKKNIKGKKYDKSLKTHCGSEGQFIESLFGIKSNSKNEPDYKGYEIKKKSKKITFGDWSASSYIFNQDKTMKKFNNLDDNITKLEFMKYFGHYNKSKSRYSWSGKCIPKYNIWNENGTIFKFDNFNNLYILYRNEKDKRNINIPTKFKKQKYYILAYWASNKLRKFLENKFNKKGFVIFEKNKNDEYCKMYIGRTITFDYFVNLFKKKNYNI